MSNEYYIIVPEVNFTHSIPRDHFYHFKLQIVSGILCFISCSIGYIKLFSFPEFSQPVCFFLDLSCLFSCMYRLISCMPLLLVVWVNRVQFTTNNGCTFSGEINFMKIVFYVDFVYCNVFFQMIKSILSVRSVTHCLLTDIGHHISDNFPKGHLALNRHKKGKVHNFWTSTKKVFISPCSKCVRLT